MSGIQPMIPVAALLLAATGQTNNTPNPETQPLHVGGSSFRFERNEEVPSNRPAEAPMSLTASDGSGLRLSRLVARALVQEPLAFTELHLTFENPIDRRLEGQFRIVLPQGVTVSRFAMKQDDRWQEGEVVEKQLARRAYEDFLHRRQDPALLEQGAANEFTARVFPIPPRGVKELIVSYSQELPAHDTPYLLPLRGLPQLGELDVMVAVDGSSAPMTMKKKSFVPDKDFVVDAAHRTGRSGLRNANLAVARVRPIASSQPDEISSAILLVDTSASRALGFSEEVKLVKHLVEGLSRAAGPKVALSVACFDQEVEPIFEGEAGAFGDAQVRQIRDRRALGASNFVKALNWAQDQARKRSAKRLILVTDGVATAGATESQELIAATLKLRSAGVERVDAIGLGGIQDDALLKRLVTAGLPRDGVVVDGSQSLTTIARRLTEGTRSGLAVNVEGAAWSWPKRLDGVQAGDEYLVYAEVPQSHAVRITVGGTAMPLAELPTAERPLLERAWAQAKIASLIEREQVEADGAAQKAAVRKQIVDLSVKHRVLSPYTALLVLETEQDYARFGIDRRSLADILSVDENGRLAVANRSPLASAPPLEVYAEAREGSMGRKEAKKEIATPGADKADQAETGAMANQIAEEAKPSPNAGPAAADLSSEFFVGTASAPPSPPPAAPVMAEPAPEAPARILAPRPASRSADVGVARGQTGSSAMAMAIPPMEQPERQVAPYTGRFKVVMDHLAAKDTKAALAAARGWHEEDPGDVMALVAMGEALEVQGDTATAARAYGSIIDLFPSRADLRRFAGERLERLHGNTGLELALDSFAKAEEERPDHPASHRLLAFAHLKRHEYSKAFDAAVRGLKQHYAPGRFPGVDQIMREDLGLIAAAWIKAEPGRTNEILSKVHDAGGTVEAEPSIRFVLNWETDANDVDFHIHDGKGGHAFYGSRQLPSGGELYADITTGYGPECFTIRLPRKDRTYPYRLQAHYYSRGPMGYGMGKLEIIDHDGKGGLNFDERSFVVMVDQAFVDLGTVQR
jgi:tetratricopeptide (TPR) repeat protein